MFQAGKILLLASAMSLAALPAQAAEAEKAAIASPAQAEPAPRIYTEAMQRQVQEGVAWVEERFGLKNLPPVDEARLPAARSIATALTQRISVEEMLDNLYGRVFKGFSDDLTKVTPRDLSNAFGMSEEAAAKVTPAQLEAVAAILDPQRAERDAQIKKLSQPIIDVALNVMIPHLQEGQARALARRLSVDELSGVQAFLQTQNGAAFARHLLPLNADPEILAAMVRTVPEMLPQLEDAVNPLINSLETLPQPKPLHRVNDAELRQVATILKADFKKLKAQVDKERAEMADLAAMADNISYEAYDRDNWSAEQRQRVEALEAASTAAQEAVRTAETAAIDDASARLSSSRPPKSAQ